MKSIRKVILFSLITSVATSHYPTTYAADSADYSTDTITTDNPDMADIGEATIDFKTALAEYRRLKSKIDDINTNIQAVNLAMNLCYYSPKEIRNIFNYDYLTTQLLPEGKSTLQNSDVRKELDRSRPLGSNQTRAQIKELVKAAELKLYNDNHRLSRFVMEHARALLSKQVSFSDAEGNATGSKSVEYTFAGVSRLKLDAAGSFVGTKFDPTRIFPRIIPFAANIAGGTANTDVVSPDGYLIRRNAQTEFMMYDQITYADLAHTAYTEEDKLYKLKETDSDTDDQYGILGASGQCGLIRKFQQAKIALFSSMIAQYQNSTPSLSYLKGLLQQYSLKTNRYNQLKHAQDQAFDQSIFNQMSMSRSIWTLYGIVRQRPIDLQNKLKWIEQNFRQIFKQQSSLTADVESLNTDDSVSE